MKWGERGKSVVKFASRADAQGLHGLREGRSNAECGVRNEERGVSSAEFRMRELALSGVLLLVFVSVTTAMANGEDLRVTVSVPSGGLKVGVDSKARAKVTVTVENTSDHKVEFYGPDFTILREGVSKTGMTTGNAFVGRRIGGGLKPGTDRESYVSLGRGESRTFEVDVSKLFVMDQMWSVIFYSPLLKELRSGRYDFAARVFVGNGDNSFYITSRIFKVEVLK